MKKKDIRKYKKNKKTFSTKEVSLLIVVITLVGIFIGTFVGYTIRINFSYRKYSSNYEEIIDTYQNIKSNYYKDIDDNELLEAAVNGMLEKLDDEYSEFLNKEETKALEETLQNEYTGIGCIIKEENGNIVIDTIYEDSSSYGKLEKGDILIKIENKEIKGLSFNDIALLISGKENTNVKITIKRKSEEKTFNLKRTKVENQTVDKEQKGTTGILAVTSFTERTPKQFRKELKALEDVGIKNLIIDLRNNAGGYISSAEEIASMFLKKGQVVYQLEKKGLRSSVKDTTKEYRNIKVVILVNHSTASSAEVLTSALKEQYGAIVVGEKTYGKGSIQKVNTLSNGTSYKYTIEKWNTSNGQVVDKKGITPDIIIGNDEKSEEDKQLLKAIEVLNKE